MGLSPAGPPTALVDAVLEVKASREERMRTFWAMSPAQRAAAYRRGQLSMATCCAWAQRYPDEPPLLNGEYHFIAVAEPEAAEARQPAPRR